MRQPVQQCLGNRTRAIRSGGIGLGLLLCLLGTQQARATSETTYDNCDLIGIDTIIAHVVGEFDTGSRRRDFLTDWIDIPHAPGWSCTRYSSRPSATLNAGLQTRMPAARGDMHIGGEKYSLYKSNGHARDSVVYIVRQRLVIPSVYTSPWRPVHTGNDAPVKTPSFSFPLAHNEGYTVNIESQVRLVKWTDEKDPNKDFPRTGHAIEFQAAGYNYWTQSKKGHGKKPWESGSPPAQLEALRPRRYSRIRVWFNRNDKTCTTPISRTVHLPAVHKSVFTGIGSVAGQIPFDLELTNCAAHIAGIDYKLVPSYLEDTNWLITHADGMLTLSPASTASGVRVQVLYESGDPVYFGERIQAPYYNAGDPTATIPLQARYIQTAPTVTPGTVLATMTVLLMYK